MTDKPEVHGKVETITPEWAELLLQEYVNKDCPHLNEKSIAQFARTMAAGEWKLNGETVIVSPQMKLLDGQNRMHACVRSGVPFRTLIAYVDEDTFATMNTGRPRTAGHTLGMMGFSHYNSLASAVRWVQAFKSNTIKATGGRTLTTEEITDICMKDPQYATSISFCLRAHKVMGQGMAAALHYIFSKVDREAADKYINDLIDGAGLPPGDPVLLYRNKVTNNRSAKRKIPPAELFAHGIAAWNSRRRGRTHLTALRTHRPRSDEKDRERGFAYPPVV